MIHHMKLIESAFHKIVLGSKTIELRLFDEKRRTIQIGDTIIFAQIKNSQNTIATKVVDLHIFDSFATLYKALPLEKCGYELNEVPDAKSDDMLQYYSCSDEKHYGVVGIEVILI